MVTVRLDPGENLIDGRYDDVTADAAPGGLLVQLRGSIRHREPSRPFSEGLQQETRMEIHMDQKAAILLAARILDLARTMGWPQLPGGGNLDEKP